MSTAVVGSIQSPILYSSTSVSKENPPTVLESEMKLELGRPAFEVTSNIRRGSRTPEPPSIYEQDALFRCPSHEIADDPLFRLPPPDPTPRFVFKQEISYTEDTPPLLMTNDSSDTMPHVQTPIYTLSSSPPRIYFASSAITFVPSVSYDFLERDPSVKGVPRNYRAWARTGRPKLDLEGAGKPEAKNDFQTMGRVYPQDSDDEEDGTEAEREKKKKKRNKKLGAGLMVPIDRPRRMLKKLLEGAPPSTPPLRRSVLVGDNKQDVEPKPGIVTENNRAKDCAGSNSEASESSGRRSSSTLLDSDVKETSKRKRRDSDKEVDDVPDAKKIRSSKRLHAKQYAPQHAISSDSVSEEERGFDYSLSEPTMDPVSAVNIGRRIAADGCRSHSSSLQTIPRARTPQRFSRPLAAEASHSVPLPTSRPGHRLSRDTSSNFQQTMPTRTFPSSLPIIPGYPSFYRRYPFITQFNCDDPAGKHIFQSDIQPKRALGNWNPPRDYRDLYTPRYTKGTGGKKIALCPICYEDPSRGGEGRQEWNHTKTSQHNYHMQYYHGISATRCVPFSPPIAQRISLVPRPQTNEKPQILQGKCHVCKQWIALEGCKLGELKVKELLWWKHAAQCHKDSRLPGEEDIFIDDDVFRRFCEYEATHPEQV